MSFWKTLISLSNPDIHLVIFFLNPNLFDVINFTVKSLTHANLSGSLVLYFQSG